MIELPPLPYPADALDPHLSRKTLELHHDKHFAAYVKKTNELIKGTPLEKAPLEEIVLSSEGPLFNNAAQAWNHDLYFRSLSPDGGGAPKGRLADLVESSFGGFDRLKEAFTKAAETHFGSGWTWLVRDGSGLKVVATHDAANPLRDKQVPLIACDVWEHAYYVDYHEERPKYVAAFWEIVNWRLAEERLGSTPAGR
jgi:Fe-Mn family superoxide dismutase